MSCFLNHSWQRCRCILIYFSYSNLFLDQFSIWSLAILLERWKIQEFCLISHANVVFESLNQESARRVYLNITREKPTTHQTHRMFNRSCANLNGPMRNSFIVFCWSQSETILLQGSLELLIFLLDMCRRALGWDWGAGLKNDCACTGWGSVVSHFNSLISEKYGWETVAIFVPLSWHAESISKECSSIKVVFTGRQILETVTSSWRQWQLLVSRLAWFRL